MAESWNKKERERKKQQNKKEKAERKLERKNNPNASNNNEMEVPFAYVDENGNLSSVPPDISKKIETNAEDIIIGVPKRDDSFADAAVRKGIVTFFNESKGYGFIKDIQSQKDFFVHVNNLQEPVKEKSEVLFEIGNGVKGLIAINVKLL